MLSQLMARMTVDEFEAFISLPENHDKHFELVDGEIVEKMVSHPSSSQVGGILYSFVTVHVITHNLGTTSGADGGYIVGEDRYIPDGAFIRHEKKNAPVKNGYLSVAPDLAIESISPTDKQPELTIKVANYLASDTVVWLADAETQTVSVFEPNKPVKTYLKNDTLLGGSVLPDFTLDLSLVFKE